MIASYLVVHRRRIKVEDLFPMQSPRDSIYWYSYGVNWRAAIAVRFFRPSGLYHEAKKRTQWICGTTPSLPGFIASVNTSFTVPVGLTHLYYICFLTGFTISAAVYCILHYVFPVSEAQRFVDSAGPVKVLIRAYREEWDGGAEEVEGVVGVRDGKV